MATSVPPKDPQVAPAVEPSGPIDAWLLSLIRDERDLIYARQILFAVLTVPPAALALFFVPTPWVWLIAPVYWVVLITQYFDKMTLLLHSVVHRPLWRRDLRIMEGFMPGLLCVFFGQTPWTYQVHHIGMHHAEGNMWNDLSTTMPYQRDNVLHWLHYACRFFFWGPVDLPGYFGRNGKKKALRKYFFGEVGWLTAMVLSAVFLDFEGTMIAFVVPTFLMRWFMMAGNWAQHAFVAQDDPKDDYKCSIQLTNCRHNRRCYNDGYHIVHHIAPGMHYLDMPKHQEEHWEEYAEHDAVIFSGITDFPAVWILLMTHQYDTLARHVVQLPGRERSHEETKAWLKSLMKPIPRDHALYPAPEVEQAAAAK